MKTNLFLIFVAIVMMSTSVACNHNKVADVTTKGKFDTMKVSPVITRNEIHNNAANTLSTGGPILSSGDVKFTNIKTYKNLFGSHEVRKSVNEMEQDVVFQALMEKMANVSRSSDGDPLTRAFNNYFKMSNSTIHYIRRSDYTPAQWDSMLVAELQSGRTTYTTGGSAMVNPGSYKITQSNFVHLFVDANGYHWPPLAPDVIHELEKTEKSTRSLWGSSSPGVNDSTDEDPIIRSIINYYNSRFNSDAYENYLIYSRDGDSTPSHVWAGCMATPIEQIMKHH